MAELLKDSDFESTNCPVLFSNTNIIRALNMAQVLFFLLLNPIKYRIRLLNGQVLVSLRK